MYFFLIKIEQVLEQWLIRRDGLRAARHPVRP
ncbi:hypothetical protein AVE30378_02129 [Achromobacter veterisilvae]|uniref:Uncharacterized protein n=1 Tax=Achromobacter veterisilvae TaxID=2069367 RepID=A0A446CEY7_9BURK|nr:hypothetical protein AVE30378_02129 [Achromobacter veterisilvae]